MFQRHGLTMRIRMVTGHCDLFQKCCVSAVLDSWGRKALLAHEADSVSVAATLAFQTAPVGMGVKRTICFIQCCQHLDGA